MRQEITIARGPGWRVYWRDNRYYLDKHRIDAPIHSYRDLQAVTEQLYYDGYIDSKTTNIMEV